MRTVSLRARPLVVEVPIERDPGEELGNASTYRGPRAGGDVGRELGPRGSPVPPGAEAPVEDVLLVEGRLRATGRVLRRRPEARRVGCERLVGQRDDAVTVDPELELRVCEQDPTLLGVHSGEAIEPESRLSRSISGRGRRAPPSSPHVQVVSSVASSPA
jgi:hypothetical protein